MMTKKENAEILAMFVAWAEKKGVTPDDLDEVTCDIMDRAVDKGHFSRGAADIVASNINNTGLEGQIGFMLEAGFTPEEVREMISSAFNEEAS
jgi:hypothetical protein